MRLQNKLVTPFDNDFKRFIKERGIEIDTSSYKIKFCPPQNFTKYREIELQTQQMNVFTQSIQVPFLSKEFCMKKYAGLTEEEVVENRVMWAKENPDKLKAATGLTSAESDQEGDLSQVGVRPEPMGMDSGFPGMDEGPPSDAGGAGPQGADGLDAGGGAPSAGGPPSGGGARAGPPPS
jgi:hypothetical protein